MSRVTTAPSTSMPFGDADIITFAVGSSATGGLLKNRFVMADVSDTTNKRPVMKPTAALPAKKIIGLIGGYRTMAPASNASDYGLGTTAKPYTSGEYVGVTIRGSDLVEAAVAAGAEGAIGFGDLIITDADGKAVKFTTQTVTPSMTAVLAGTAIGTAVSGATATIGDTNVGPIITGATATLSSDPTATEVKAWAEEIIEATIAAEAVKMKAFLSEVLPAYGAIRATAIKAYLAEYVSDYVNAGNAGLDAVIGVALGAPDTDKLVPFVFLGRA